MKYQNDYVLGTYIYLFQIVAVWDARHNMDHYLVMGCLRGVTPDAHSLYLEKRTRFPIRPKETLYRIYRMFAKIWRAILRPPLWERHRQAWISPETWSLIDTRIVARRWKNQWISRVLSRMIKAGLQEDRRRQAANVGSTVDSLLASNPTLIQGTDLDTGLVQGCSGSPPPSKSGHRHNVGRKGRALLAHCTTRRANTSNSGEGGVPGVWI